MSLIADALKRAQEQRSASPTDDKARRMLTAPGPLRVATGDGPTITRPLAVAVAGVVVAVGVLVGSILMAPTAQSAAATRAVPDGSSVAPSADRLSAAGTGSPYAVPPEGEEGIPAADEADEGPASATTAWTGRTSPALGSGGGAGDDSDAPGRRSDPPTDDAAPSRRVAESSPRDGPGTGAGDGGSTAAEGEASSSFRITVGGGMQERTAAQYFASALAAHQSGDLERAVTLYRSAIELRPGDAELWNNLGAVYRRLSRPEDALDAFRSALGVMPSYAPAWSNLGLVLEGLGRDAEAIEAYREALEQDPGNAGAKVNLANKYQALGMSREARSLLREVLQVDPSLPEAHYGLARVLEDDGETREAARHYRLFLEMGRGQFPVLEARVAEHLSSLEGGGE